MFLFDVPFMATEKYLTFLQQQSDRLGSLYFPLDPELNLDARHRSRADTAKDLAGRLKPFSGIKKYGLANTRFIDPASYEQRPEDLARIIETLDILLTEDNIDGIVFADFYLLQALSSTSPVTASRLEAVPSVNCMLDSFDKIAAAIDIIHMTRFRPPGKIILDRSLNRKLADLGRISAACRNRYPEIKLELLANEGCLFQCPFKPAHDAQISYANIHTGNSTFYLNNTMGCIDVLHHKPHYLFKSPFIRPEDQNHYEPYVDSLKICGRTLGADFLIHTISAYVAGSYDGNLLGLMDTMEWLKSRLYVDNSRLPDNFCATLSTCDRDCDSCSFCRLLLKKYSRRLPFRIPDWRIRPARS